MKAYSVYQNAVKFQEVSDKLHKLIVKMRALDNSTYVQYSVENSDGSFGTITLDIFVGWVDAFDRKMKQIDIVLLMKQANSIYRKCKELSYRSK